MSKCIVTITTTNWCKSASKAGRSRNWFAWSTITYISKIHGDVESDVTPKTVMSMTVEHAKDSSECKKTAVTCTL